MRVKFFEVKDRRTAQRRAPWAARIVKVEGGYMAFESIDDWEMWRGQRYVRVKFFEVKDRRTAQRRAPWAARIVKVEGGYMAFENLDDWEMWRMQR